MTKERLRQYREIRAEAIELRDEIDELTLSLRSPRVPDFGEVQSHGGIESSVTEDLLIRLESLKRMYHDKIRWLMAEQEAIEHAITAAGLDPVERRLLRLRYIDGLKWEIICTRLHYSWKSTHRIHARALAKINAIE